MLVVMSHDATEEDIQRVVRIIEEMGYQARPIPGRQRTAIGLIGNDGRVDSARLEGLPGVIQVIHVSQPYKQVSREWRPEPTVVELPNGTRIGGRADRSASGHADPRTAARPLRAGRGDLAMIRTGRRRRPFGHA